MAGERALPQEMEEKLRVLEQIARAFREEKICWAVGGSLLLYFKGITQTVHDIDLMVWEPDIDKARELLLTMGTLCPPRPQGSYRTRHFLEFVMGEVEVDVMAGFVILKEDRSWDCSLQPRQIAEYLPLGTEVIPFRNCRCGKNTIPLWTGRRRWNCWNSMGSDRMKSLQKIPAVTLCGGQGDWITESPKRAPSPALFSCETLAKAGVFLLPGAPCALGPGTL